jgi:arabinoxylan arabinofuranohydrolase
VATSDSPSGPFTNSGKPLIDFKSDGFFGGYEIDPDIFKYPRSDNTYLYRANDYLALVPLNDDFRSFDKSN